MKARISFTGSINTHAENLIVTAFYEAAQIPEVATVDFILSSWGGSIDCGISIYNHLKSIDLKISCYNSSTIESIAIPIFMAGDFRYSTPTGKFMVHEYLWPIKEDNDINIAACEGYKNRLEVDQNRVLSILSENGATISKEELFPVNKQYNGTEWAIQRGIIVDERPLPTYTSAKPVFWRTLFTG